MKIRPLPSANRLLVAIGHAPFFQQNRHESIVKSYVHYLREYLKKPTEIGALAPSSDGLAKAMLKGLDLENARTVLEYGPGSGSVTDHIRRKISPHTKLAAIEINPRMAELFKERHPDVHLFSAFFRSVLHRIPCLQRSRFQFLAFG